ncbi:MAG: Orotidine 5-phosphate decarboxylase [Candidatus Kaiserbacteria bacterium]|nr:Orotidine 5-phosphate decarboxylase [Candidatus Kaiserbacteria bacterium]
MHSIMERNFRALLEAQWDKQKFLCIGLDPSLEKIPRSIQRPSTRETITAFNRALIDATKDVAGAYKVNAAFYEAHGDEGWAALRETVEYVHEQALDLPVILDAKRADIGSSNEGYVMGSFKHMRSDAITVQPYLGSEALEPFLSQANKGIIVLCRTSNEGSGELQDLIVDGEPLFIRVARLVSDKWNTNKNCALVVGATYPDELRRVRAVVGDMPILIPGVGAQGGDLEKTVLAGKDARGRGFIISSSRAIIYASSGPDFAEAARAEALRTDSAIRAVL